MFATGLAIYATLYIAARFVPYLMPQGTIAYLVGTAAMILSWSLMAASLVEFASRFLP